MENLGRILQKLGLKKPPPPETPLEPERPPPKDVQELIDRLPEAYKKYRKRELPYRLASAVAFIVLCIVCGTLAWKNTQVYRAPMDNVPKDLRKIDLEVTLHIVPTSKLFLDKVPLLEERILARLNEGDLPVALNIRWNIQCHGFRKLASLQTNTERGLNVYLALVDPAEWTHFSANHAFMTCSQWTLIQFGDDLEKMAQRIGSLVWEVLIDVPHLESIVKRDQRELMPAWQIATLPLSHQKRLVWDSAALAGEYVVQIVFLHQNAKLDEEVKQRATRTTSNFWRFASRIKNVTRLQITSEHLWDFEVMHYLEKDVQDRWTLTADSTQNVIKEVDMQMQTVESASPVLKMIVLETDMPVIILDHTNEDSKGVAVASWGALVARNDKTDAHLLSSLRVLLGMDSELEGGRAREPCPVNEWEISRMHLRAFIDNTLRTRSAIRALHSMKDKIPDIVISDDVASLVNEALTPLNQWNDPHNPDLATISKARLKADKALSHPSLLALLYFPQDQKTAVLLPIIAPLSLPLLGSVWTLWKLGRKWQFVVLLSCSLLYYQWTQKILPVVIAHFLYRILLNWCKGLFL